MILVVEDEEKLSRAMCEFLEHMQYKTHVFNDGDKVTDWVKENQPNLILLDLMLPSKDGITVCREIREFSNIPIIMLTARTDEIDRLLGLELGADDYICKPYSLREVEARIRAVLRRVSPQKTPSDPELQINRSNYHVDYKGKSIELTAVEFKLLEALYENSGHIFSRSQLMDRAYDDARIVSDRTVDSHIKKLRKKLTSLSDEVQFIHSIYGVGYKFDI